MESSKPLSSVHLTVSTTGDLALAKKGKTWFGRAIQKIGDRSSGTQRFDVLSEKHIDDLVHSIITPLRRDSSEKARQKALHNLKTLATASKALLSTTNQEAYVNTQLRIKDLISKIDAFCGSTDSLKQEVDDLQHKLKEATNSYLESDKTEKSKEEFKKTTKALLHDLDVTVGLSGVSSLYQRVKDGDIEAQATLEKILSMYTELNRYIEGKRLPHDIEEVKTDRANERLYMSILLQAKPNKNEFNYPQFLLAQTHYSSSEEQLEKNKKLLGTLFSIDLDAEYAYSKILGEQFRDKQTGDLNIPAVRESYIQDCLRQFVPGKQTFLQGREITRDELQEKRESEEPSLEHSSVEEPGIEANSQKKKTEAEIIAENFEKKLSEVIQDEPFRMKVIAYLQQGARGFEEEQMMALFKNFSSSEKLFTGRDSANVRAINVSDDGEKVVLSMRSIRPLGIAGEESPFNVEINTGIILHKDGKGDQFTISYRLEERQNTDS